METIQKARVFNAWDTVNSGSTTETGLPTSTNAASAFSGVDSLGSEIRDFEIAGPGSGSKPMSSGLRDMKISGGKTPTAKVKSPMATQAVRQPHPPMISWAARGMTARPAPLDIASMANPRGRRRMNQLLMAVGILSSSGPAKTIRPGT